MPIDWAALMAATLAGRLAVEAHDELRRRLERAVSDGPLEDAFREAWQGFAGSLENSGFDLGGRARAQLEELFQDDAFQRAFGELVERPFDEIDTSACRGTFRALAPPGAGDGDFEAAWRALGRRFQNAVAASAELSRLLGHASDVRREGREAHQLELLEQVVGLLEDARGSRGSDLGRYLQRLRAAHCDLPIAGFETRVRLPIQLDEVYIPLRARAVRAVLEREWRQVGASRELAAEAHEDRDVAFDESLRLAARHGLRGAVILGDPGSGKTTLLKHFVLAVTDAAKGPSWLGLPDDTVPVLVELRRLDDPAAGLRPAIEQALADADPALDAAAFAGELLARDHVLVLVDGLDEVADAATRAAVSRWLEVDVRRLDGWTFVVTSRYAGYKADTRLDGRFLELRVRDVEQEAAARFIQAWYLAVESQAELGRDAEVAQKLAGEAAADLVEKIFEAEDQRTLSIRRLAANPLMLQILCLVHRDRKQLPKRRVELYRECVQVLLELWRRAKGLAIDFDAQEALRLLQPLAFWLHRDNKEEAPLAEILPRLREPLEELGRPPEAGGELLRKIRDQSGVLVSLGQSQYGFLHLSFQEYLSALYLQDRFAADPEILPEVAGRFGDPWWREVILLSLGLNTPSLFEPLLAAVLAAEALHRDPALADDCLRDALVKSPRPVLRALEQGVESAEERFHALRLLKGLPGWEEKATASGGRGRELVRRLAREDEDRQVRGMAAELLGGAVEEVEVAGQERVNEQDGSVLVYVPEGDYALGTDEDLEAYAKENRQWPKPRHQVRLSAYWIGKYPLTNEQYGRFLAANPGHRKPGEWGDKEFNQPQQPVVGVSWQDALAYCRWARLGLPTEAQWEAAARGTDQRRFPWGGEEPSPELANYDGREGKTTPVGSYPKGAGPYGTLDQAGNVWEWCQDRFEERAYADRDSQEDPVVPGDEGDTTALRVVRGGSWANPAGFLPAALRRGNEARYRLRFLGFRVVCVGSGPER